MQPLLDLLDRLLMFLDIYLPYIQGIELLRQLPEFSNLPVIVVSGGGTIGSVAKALTIGADAYITKPFEPIWLMARIETVSRRIADRRIERTTFSSKHMLLDFDRTE